MPDTALPVEHLFTLTANTRAPMFLSNGPQGTRVIVYVTGGSFEGPKLKGTVLENSGGDWTTLRANGVLRLDVRLTLMAADGAPILMTYQGLSLDGGARIRTAPLFETGDERYAWMNDIQAVATGGLVDGGVRYDVYALL